MAINNKLITYVIMGDNIKGKVNETYLKDNCNNSNLKSEKFPRQFQTVVEFWIATLPLSTFE